MNGTSRKNLISLLRVALGVGLLVYLFFRMRDEFDGLGEVLLTSLSNWPWWAFSLGLTFLGLLVGALRWYYILRAARLPLPWTKVFSIFFIGQFFNSFMLGACGGDLARALYVAREWPGKKTEAAMTALIDRAVGLLVLVVFGSAVALYRFRLFFDNIGNRWMGIVMVSFLLGAAALILLLLRKNLFDHWSLFRRWEERTKTGAMFRKVYDAFFIYHRNIPALIVSVILSFLNLALLTLACMCIGISLGVDLRMRDYFTIFPVITVISSLPLTPGGLGVREGMFIELLDTLGIGAVQAMPLSLMTYLGGLLWSLFGGLIFLGYSSSVGRTPKRELEALTKSAK